jgi:hypothetical protein
VVPEHLLPINSFNDYTHPSIRNALDLSTLTENQELIGLGILCRKSLPKKLGKTWKHQALLTANEIEHAYGEVYKCYYNIVEAARKLGDETVGQECYLKAMETRMGWDEVAKWKVTVENGNNNENA